MSIEQMKAEILKKYPRWSKVNTMSDRQVMAIYFRMIGR